MNQMIEDSGILMFVGSQWSKFWLISTYPQGPDDIFPTPALSVPAKKRLARPDTSQSPSLNVEDSWLFGKKTTNPTWIWLAVP